MKMLFHDFFNEVPRNIILYNNHRNDLSYINRAAGVYLVFNGKMVKDDDETLIFICAPIL